MALFLQVIDRRSPSNKMRRQLQAKKTKVSHFYSSKRHFTLPSLLTRQSVLVLKVDVSVIAKEDYGKAVISAYIQ